MQKQKSVRDKIVPNRKGVRYAMITVDPGVRSTGWAYWRVRPGPVEEPKASGVIRAAGSLGWQEAVRIAANEFGDILWQYEQTGANVKVVIEWPELWTASGKSMASGSKGQLFKLAYLVGGFGVVTEDAFGTIPILVTPGEWKGQLPKKAVMARIKKAIGKTYRDHEADSVGLGLWIQGAL